MPIARRILSAVGYLVLALLVAASLGSVAMGHPFLLEVEQSNSMFPLLQKGDVAVVLPLPPSAVRVGSIVLYHAEKGSLKAEQFIVHRVVGGNAQQGYITKGDHNNASDQAAGATTRVPPAWIQGIVPTIGREPVKIPLIGYAALWAGSHLKNLYVLPALGALLVFGVALLGRGSGVGRRRRQSRSELMAVAVLTAGLVLSSITAAVILVSSQREVAPYAVAHGTGVFTGGGVGILEPGRVVHATAANLTNHGAFPLAVLLVSPDPNLSFSPPALWLPPHGRGRVHLTLVARGLGMHNSAVWVGLFPPLLPLSVLAYLAHRSFWLALAVVAAVPSLPFIAYLLFAPRLGRAALRLGKRALRPIVRLLALS